MTRRSLLPLLASALILAGCGGSSSSPSSRAADNKSAAPSPGASAAASVATGSSTGGAVGATSGGAGATSSTTTGGAAAPAGTGGTSGGAAAPGAASDRATATAPGTYTYDNSGTVTVGTPKDASGTSTLTVDPPTDAGQHSALADDQGKTEQDTVVRATGTYLARLAITNPAFNKEFRLTPPVLLVPDPATPERSWSWSARSTDGKTTAHVTATVTRRETLAIGGQQTPTSVISSTLKLTGDITYTGQMETWYDPAHRLAVKEHTKGSGTVGGVAFTTDITSVLRSTRPS